MTEKDIENIKKINDKRPEKRMSFDIETMIDGLINCGLLPDERLADNIQKSFRNINVKTMEFKIL